MILTPRGLLAFGRTLPCTVGRAGLTDRKREGDGATPRGLHRIEAVLYRPDRLPSPSPWAHPILPGDQWSDDPGDPAYNGPVRRSPLGHEEMRRPDPLYDLVLVLDWNRPALPGRGSAIFVHRWRRPGAPTAGCIALAPGDLRWLARRVRPGTPLRV